MSITTCERSLGTALRKAAPIDVPYSIQWMESKGLYTHSSVNNPFGRSPECSLGPAIG